MLGHELTHGFDNSGRHYDSNGNVRQWWTNETIVKYTEKTDCFIHHYNTYYEAEVRTKYIFVRITYSNLKTFSKHHDRWNSKLRYFITNSGYANLLPSHLSTCILLTLTKILTLLVFDLIPTLYVYLYKDNDRIDHIFVRTGRRLYRWWTYIGRKYSR